MTKYVSSLSFLVTVALLSFFVARAPAATFNIANGDVAGLINAINTANANNANDTINLAAGGSYSVTAAVSGEDAFPVIITDSGHTLTINGNGASMSRSGSAVFRFFHNQGNATIANLTMTGGSADHRSNIG